MQEKGVKGVEEERRGCEMRESLNERGKMSSREKSNPVQKKRISYSHLKDDDLVQSVAGGQQKGRACGCGRSTSKSVGRRPQRVCPGKGVLW